MIARMGVLVASVAPRRSERDVRQDRAVTGELEGEPPLNLVPLDVHSAGGSAPTRPTSSTSSSTWWSSTSPFEYVPSVISEGFTLSLLTALLLKVALEVVILIKSHIVAGLRAASTRRAKAAIGVALWVVAAGSKFVVLKLVDLIFGDAVSLGGFIPVTLLIVALLISRAAVRRLLDSPLPVG
jgi:hypothetical protein